MANARPATVCSLRIVENTPQGISHDLPNSNEQQLFFRAFFFKKKALNVS